MSRVKIFLAARDSAQSVGPRCDMIFQSEQVETRPARISRDVGKLESNFERGVRCETTNQRIRQQSPQKARTRQRKHTREQGICTSVQLMKKAAARQILDIPAESVGI